MTKEDKVAWDRLLEYRDELQSEVSMFAEAYRRSRNSQKKERALDMWKFEQKLYDKMNDNLPKRYRKQLTDRSWKEGASRPGSQKKRTWPGD